MSEILNIYDSIAPEIADFYEKQTHSKSIKRLYQNLNSGAKILDLGCGSGRDVKMFSDLGFDSLGVDGSKGMIREAKKRYPGEKFTVMDSRSLKFPSETFSGVWSWSVLTHLSAEDKKKTLKQIHRILRKNGVFVQTIWHGHGRFVNPQFHPRPHYLLKRPSWKKLYKESGFSGFESRVIKGIGRDSIRISANKA